mmetsp:Transcript_9941/g.32587  ORF Transcript_9941/g.32587 Transcript_9941/m.32587 type:complete len:92 (-) Transcript_9941:855-1130(-)
MVQPLTVAQQQALEKIITKLVKLQGTMGHALSAAIALLHRGGSRRDVDKAYETYANTIATYETAVMLHHQSVGLALPASTLSSALYSRAAA